MGILPHPPYSPDISPCDYYLFLSLSNFLSNKRFNSEEDIKTEVNLFFRLKNPKFFLWNEFTCKTLAKYC